MERVVRGRTPGDREADALGRVLSLCMDLHATDHPLSLAIVKVPRWALVALPVSAGVIGAVLALLVTDRDPGHTPTVLATAVVAVVVAAITAVATDRRQ